MEQTGLHITNDLFFSGMRSLVRHLRLYLGLFSAQVSVDENIVRFHRR